MFPCIFGRVRRLSKGYVSGRKLYSVVSLEEDMKEIVQDGPVHNANWLNLFMEYWWQIFELVALV